jgi:hypothetical protein
MNLDKARLAREVLIKARDSQIDELALCGSSGGIGRASNYAPALVNIMNAINLLDVLMTPVELTPNQARMAEVRAAKSKAE